MEAVAPVIVSRGLMKRQNDLVEFIHAHHRIPEPSTLKKISIRNQLLLVFFFSLKRLRLPNRTQRKLLKFAKDTGYLNWPLKISSLISGARVLDFGSGGSLHFVGYLMAGAKRYVGYDPAQNFDSTLVKSKKTGERVDVERPLSNMGSLFEQAVFTNKQEDLSDFGQFDVVILHNVTEHLLDLPREFDLVASLLRPEGLIVFHHHNFFCWDGHHSAPKREEDRDSENESHNEVADWAHIDFHPPATHRLSKSLNRISLDELRKETDSRFDVLYWKEIISPEGKGAGRFDRIPKTLLDRYTLRDLTTKNVLCVAQRLESA